MECQAVYSKENLLSELTFPPLTTFESFQNITARCRGEERMMPQTFGSMWQHCWVKRAAGPWDCSDGDMWHCVVGL